jgi:hypothetical protein
MLLIAVLANAAPFIVWGVLYVVGRILTVTLRPTLPWLHASRWAAWLIGMPLVVAALAWHRYSWLFPVGMCLASWSIAFGIVEGWVKKRYAPELLPPEPDGWWPAPRE